MEFIGTLQKSRVWWVKVPLHFVIDGLLAVLAFAGVTPSSRRLKILFPVLCKSAQQAERGRPVTGSWQKTNSNIPQATYLRWKLYFRNVAEPMSACDYLQLYVCLMQPASEIGCRTTDSSRTGIAGGVTWLHIDAAR